ncbi:MAG: tyrosine-type recombinase/integrase [Terriglobales bacterium]|jgi:integrase
MTEETQTNIRPTRRRSRRKGAGTIYRQPGCGTWSIQYYKNGKRIRESTGETDYAAAQQNLALRLGAIAKGEHIERPRRPVQVSELFEGLIREYKVNGRKPKAIKNLTSRWEQHLREYFDIEAQNVTTDLVQNYRNHRLDEGSRPANINRELAALRTAFSLGLHSTPPKIRMIPYIPMLEENNRRTGFVEDADFERLAANATELWLRLWLELSFTYCWRRGELLGLRVRQVNFINRTIRLDPGTTKNGEGREVAMTAKVTELLKLAVVGKQNEDYVLTRMVRRKQKPIRDMRDAWTDLTTRAGMGGWICALPRCRGEFVDGSCQQCGGRKRIWKLLPHDMRRSGAKALRAAGVPQSVIMGIGGWKTDAMFRRYAINSSSDQRAAVEMLEKNRLENARRAQADGHDFSHDPAPATTNEGAALAPKVN